MHDKKSSITATKPAISKVMRDGQDMLGMRPGFLIRKSE